MNSESCPHCKTTIRQFRDDGRCEACGKLLPEALRALSADETSQGLSKLVHCVSWAAAVLTVAATAYWIAIIADGNYGLDGFAFTMGMAAPLGGGTLVSVLLPSAILYLRSKQRRDLKSLYLAAGSILALAIEAVLVCCVIPQRGG